MNLDRKNILLIIHNGSLGGAERQGLSLGKYLTENLGCKVYLLLTFSKMVTPEFQQFAAQCHILKTFHFGEPYLVLKREIGFKNVKRLVWSSKYLFRMRKGLKSYKFDAIFPFLNYPSKVAFYLSKLLPTVKFTFWHQLGLDIFKNDLFENYAARNMPCLIANAPNGVDLFLNAHPESRIPQYILPQFLAFKPDFRDKKPILASLDIPQGSICIGMVAHYRSEKLHQLVLAAFTDLLKERNDIYLLFLGNKNNSDSTLINFNTLKSEIKHKGLSHKVKVMSQKPLNDVLSALDIGVLMSDIEGTPNAVMEYMAYGSPIIATNHPGCKLLLHKSDFLINNDLETLKLKMSALISSEKLRITEGAKNLSLIKKFTPEKYIARLVEIMNKES